MNSFGNKDLNTNSNTSSKGRVLVAMSGGVDSSVAAALLVEQGYDVVGVTMQVWDYTQCDIEEGNGTCCSSTDVDDARAVADKLNIPFYVMNCEAKFKEKVIDPFVQSYLDGNTPLPCVDCNTYLKFDHLIQKMKELDCQYLATGHYASLKTDENNKTWIETSTDEIKDQTYFLFTLNPEIVPYLLFPIGHLKKPELRQMAEERGLLVARKKDSTGICFVGDKGYVEFLNQQLGDSHYKKGKFRRYPDGEILGEHQGIHLFTYGQRRGFGLDHHETMFVIKTDPKTQDVWLGEEKYLFQPTAKIRNFHMLGPVQDGERLRVKIRYSHKGAWARIRLHDANSFSPDQNAIVKSDLLSSANGTGIVADLVFEESQRAITPGQAAVCYRDNALVGGGWFY